MKKKSVKKLALSKETLGTLQELDIRVVLGGSLSGCITCEPGVCQQT
jgi:hypothetical protein